MRALRVLISLALSSMWAFSQAPLAAPAFDVASVKASQHEVGPDYNNQITYSPTGITARNATLKRLLADAYHLQLNQILGPSWLERNEYEIDARTAGASTREQMALMLRSLVAERFKLKQRSETREMRVYALEVGKSGAKIHPIHEGETGKAVGVHFHGDMRQFADLLAVQFSMPAAASPSEPVRASSAQNLVVDKTGLEGVFDFSVDVHPELGTDAFTLWQRALEDQLGLRIESRKENVAVLVVDDALKIPTEN
jgi:uncharacterized protein (TIGR03435 family)